MGSMMPGTWRRSRGCADGACVEVRQDDDNVAVRSSEQPEIVVRFSKEEWKTFVVGVKRGEFDSPRW